MTPTAWYCVAPVRLAFIVQERQKTERIIFSSLDKFSLTSCEKSSSSISFALPSTAEDAAGFLFRMSRNLHPVGHSRHKLLSR